jgi:hypothetical protein
LYTLFKKDPYIERGRCEGWFLENKSTRDERWIDATTSGTVTKLDETKKGIDCWYMA